jgi:hypothetical protein
MNNARKTLKVFIFSCLLFLFLVPNAVAKTIYMGPSESYTNLSAAFNAMTGGDTLIIRAGTYTGSNNAMTDSNAPPNGTASNYTIIKAENDGAVTFDGQNTRNMFLLRAYTGGAKRYLQFEGINWFRASGSGVYIGGLSNDHAHHIKFFRCGAESGSGSKGFDINYADYILLEECYSFGEGRYGFIAFVSSNVIFRRTVSRMDAARGGGMPVSNYMDYASTNVEFQNAIAINGDDSYWSNFSENDGSFTTRKTWGSYSTTNAFWRGVIALDNDYNRAGDSTGWYASGGLHLNQDIRNANVIDSVFWNTGSFMYAASQSVRWTMDHVTAGDMKNTSGQRRGIYDNNQGTVTNTILYGIRNEPALRNVRSSNYNVLYNNDSNTSNTSLGPQDITTIDPSDGLPGSGVPALKYLVRIENGSDLDGTASDGGDRGATILKRIGISGTLYGEPGYNQVTDEELWPFPYENHIRAGMRTYNPGGTNASKPDGKRGFCADGQTLTRYIWEYLGNPMPDDLAGSLSPQGPPPPVGLRIVP